MKGFIIKDLITFYRYFKNKYFPIVIIIIIILSFTVFKSDFMMIIILTLFLLINFNANLFVDDEKTGWLTFVKTNIRSKISLLVLSRYISAIITTLSLNSFVLIMIISHYFVDYEYTPKQLFIIGSVIIYISMIYIVGVIPFLYLFLQNGMMVFVVFIVIFILIFKQQLDYVVVNTISTMSSSVLISSGIFMLLLVVLLCYLLSIAILNYKLRSRK